MSHNSFSSSIICWIIRLLSTTWRWQVQGNEHLATKEQKMICAWHGELLLVVLHLQRNKNYPTLLVSQHQDGQLIADLLETWSFPLIRGSTNSRGALTATRQMLTLLKSPQGSIGLAADGPKGPAHQIKSAAMQIAQKTNSKLILIRAVASRAWHINSWDKMMIPKPFSRITIHIAQMSPPQGSKQAACLAFNQRMHDLPTSLS